jgi:hypothetical protein
MPIYRVARRLKNGEIETRDFPTPSVLLKEYQQIGVEEDSYAMRLHGEPILRGLVGPLTDGKQVVRYETPDVYTQLTEIWSKTKRPRKKPGQPAPEL